MMLFYVLLAVFGLISDISAAAVNAVRQDKPLPSTTTPPKCPVATLYSYITVTVTNIPGTVTIAVPDYSAISKSLASAHTIDSIVVVEQSIDRPFSEPPDPRIPTFLATISALAIEATEAPNSGDSVIYIPNSSPPHLVAISTNIDSIVLTNFPTIGVVPSTSKSTTVLVSPAVQTFTVPSAGWNASDINATTTLSAFGSGLATDLSPTNIVTSITYVNTTTAEVTVTVPPTSATYDYSGYGAMVKRQTCVLISANINGQWASWCNNWDGSTTYTYTSWETTVTPGAARATPSTTLTSTEDATTTVPVTGPATTLTETLVSASSSNNAQPTAPASASASTGSGSSPPLCSGTSSSFTIGFDDLPANSVFENMTASLPLIDDPYNHFFWAQGWSYVPPPKDPYPPHDGSELGVYVPVGQNTSPATSIGDIPLGGFGAGNRSATSAYWFDLQSAWVGCDNNVTDPSDTCDFVAEGYQYEPSTNTNRLAITQHYFQPLCHSSSCELTQVFFSDSFSQLSAISFYANINGQIQTFYVDTLQLSWWNGTCEAEELRASQKE